MQRQNDGNDRDRAERIAAAQRLLAQALASGINARSMEESLLGGGSRLGVGPGTPERQAAPG